MAHTHTHRSMPDAERRLDVATADSRRAQIAVTRAADNLVKSGEKQKTELKRVTEDTQERLKRQDERREARRSSSIETALEALKAIGRPH